jgi:hypothetical protein
MKKIAVFILLNLIISLGRSFSQSEEIGFRMINEKIGEINGKIYFAIEKPSEVNGEKAMRTDPSNHKALIVFNEDGFLFHKQLDQLNNFPNEFEIVKSIIFQNKIYSLIAKKITSGSLLKILEINENLEIVNDNFLEFNVSSKFEEVQMKKIGNQLAVLSKTELKGNKFNQVELIGIDLISKKMNQSQVNIEIENSVVLGDFTINNELNLHAIYYSIERSNLQKIENFSSVYLQMINSNANFSEYDYSSNKEFVPSSYKFLKVNEKEFYLAAIANPIEGANTGFFVWENDFSVKLDLTKGKVSLSDDFLKDENWSKEDYKVITKGESPFKYAKYQIKDFFLANNQLNIICIEAGYFGQSVSGSTMNASSASSVGGATPASSGGSFPEMLEKNLVFYSLNPHTFENVVFFKTVNKETADLFDFNVDYTHYLKENKLFILFRVNKFSEEYGVTKKELNMSLMNGSELIKLEYDFESNSKKYSLLKTEDKRFYQALELAFILNNKIHFLTADKILQLSRIERNRLVSFEL